MTKDEEKFHSAIHEHCRTVHQDMVAKGYECGVMVVAVTESKTQDQVDVAVATSGLATEDMVPTIESILVLAKDSTQDGANREGHILYMPTPPVDKSKLN